MRLVARSRAGAGQNGVPCRPRRLGMTVGTIPAWRPGQSDQQCRLAGGQRCRRATEIDPGPGPNPLEIAAERRQRQIHRQNFALREAAFQLQGARHLEELAGEGALVRLQQSRRLHRQGRGAGDDTAVNERLPAGPDDGQGIDAGVVLEALVLVGHQHPQVARVDFVDGGRQAEETVLGQIGPQRPSLPVDHLSRQFLQARQVRRIGAVELGQAEPAGDAEYPNRANRNSQSPPPHGALTFGPSMSGPRCGRDSGACTCPRRSCPAARSARVSPRGRHRRARTCAGGG